MNITQQTLKQLRKHLRKNNPGLVLVRISELEARSLGVKPDGRTELLILEYKDQKSDNNFSDIGLALLELAQTLQEDINNIVIVPLPCKQDLSSFDEKALNSFGWSRVD